MIQNNSPKKETEGEKKKEEEEERGGEGERQGRRRGRGTFTTKMMKTGRVGGKRGIDHSYNKIKFP